MAKKPPKFIHLVGTDIVVPLEDVYGTDAMSTVCGIKKVDSNTNPLPTDYRSYKSINQLTSSGIVRRAFVKVPITDENGKAANKLRTIYIIAANTPKIGALRGVDYGTPPVKVITAYYPGRISNG